MATVGNWLNFSVVPIELFCLGNKIWDATGFFVRWHDNWYLVSNWHVFSGRDPRTGQPRHDRGAVPDSLSYKYLSVAGDKINILESAPLPLAQPDEITAVWLQHPDFGQFVDIGAIELGLSPVGHAKDILEKTGHDPEMFIDIGRDVFLPGYPLRLSSNGVLPILKRASVASSLEINPGFGLFFHVDTASREGMSGSPCFAIANDGYFRLIRDSNKMERVIEPFHWRFLGVYSGRFKPSDGLEAQIGLIWREHLLYSILDKGQPGTYRLIKSA